MNLTNFLYMYCKRNGSESEEYGTSVKGQWCWRQPEKNKANNNK